LASLVDSASVSARVSVQALEQALALEVFFPEATEALDSLDGSVEFWEA
jgi:hypothetical protein